MARNTPGPNSPSLDDLFYASFTTGPDGKPVLAVGNADGSSINGSGASSSQVQGSSDSGAADSGFPVKVAGKFNLTLPTFTDGQRGDLQIDQRGNLRTVISNGSNLQGFAADNTDGAAVSATINKPQEVARNTVFNGTTWDRQPGNTIGTYMIGASLRQTLQASAAQTTSGSSSAYTGGGPYNYAVATLNCTASSGTTPTLNVKLQISDDGGTTWYDLPSGGFTQLTATGSQAIQISNFGDTIRAAWTVGGTTPSFTFAVKLVLTS